MAGGTLPIATAPSLLQERFIMLSKKSNPLKNNGAPDMIRTYGLWIRNRIFYLKTAVLCSRI